MGPSGENSARAPRGGSGSASCAFGGPYRGFSTRFPDEIGKALGPKMGGFLSGGRGEKGNDGVGRGHWWAVEAGSVVTGADAFVCTAHPAAPEMDRQVSTSRPFMFGRRKATGAGFAGRIMAVLRVCRLRPSG